MAWALVAAAARMSGAAALVGAHAVQMMAPSLQTQRAITWQPVLAFSAVQSLLWLLKAGDVGMHACRQ